MEAGARARRAPVGVAWLQALRLTASDYVALTKPRVISLLLVTTVATMFVADPTPAFGLIVLTMIGGYLAAGGAGAINHYLERDIDANMSRTSRRPLPAGRIEPRTALWFGIVLGALSFALFALTVNMTAALLAISGLLGYVFVYTLWLKPITSQNIVIGGAAGAVPPLVGWAAAAGHLDPSAFYLFAIVFYWTPPHFWALALLIKDDYARTGIPMLPVVDGEDETTAPDPALRLAAARHHGAAAGRWPLRLGLCRRRVRARLAVRLALPSPAPPRRPAIRLDPLPLLARLPCAPLRRDGGRPCSLAIGSRTMDRKLARKNVMSGLVLVAIAAVMFGLTFLVASTYLN